MDINDNKTCKFANALANMVCMIEQPKFCQIKITANKITASDPTTMCQSKYQLENFTKVSINIIVL